MATIEQVLARFESQVGTAENPHGSNDTPYCSWYGVVGPWCAMFVSWCFFHEGLPLPASTRKGFAYCPSGAKWFMDRGRWTATPRRGAVVFFDFPGDNVNRISHVGVVTAVNGDGTIDTIEGNTDERGGRTGGRVMRRRRRVGIVGYGIPDFHGESTPPPPPVSPPVQTSTGSRMARRLVVVPLGADGLGWVGPPHGMHVPFNRVAALTPNGPFPPRDGYWGPARVSKHDEGGELVVVADGRPHDKVGVWIEVLEP